MGVGSVGRDDQVVAVLEPGTSQDESPGVAVLESAALRHPDGAAEDGDRIPGERTGDD